MPSWHGQRGLLCIPTTPGHLARDCGTCIEWDLFVWTERPTVHNYNSRSSCAWLRYVHEKRPIRIDREAYCAYLQLQVILHVTAVSVWKETYLYGERGLFCMEREVYFGMEREAYCAYLQLQVILPRAVLKCDTRPYCKWETRCISSVKRDLFWVWRRPILHIYMAKEAYSAFLLGKWGVLSIYTYIYIHIYIYIDI